MFDIKICEDDLRKIEYERFNYPDIRVQRKFEALYLKAMGFRHCDIEKIAGISENTLLSCFSDYKTGRIDKLKQNNYYHPKSDLQDFKTSIEEYLIQNPPATIKEAKAKIKELTGIERCETQIRCFLKGLGFKYKKVGMIPKGADHEEQKRFIKSELEPRIKEAEEGKRQLYFMDAAHFVHKAFLGFLWCITKFFVKSPSGRKRFNILGAIDAITHQLIMVANDRYINACSVCELLKKIVEQGLKVPITIVLDNARYQKCRLVNELVEELNRKGTRIELLYLPSYSPNLNIIERLWRFVKRKCLYSKYYETFSSFKEAIKNCLDLSGSKYKKELDTFLSLKYQLFAA